MDEKKCDFLNTTGGIGAYLCTYDLKIIRNADRCKECKYHTERENENEH